VLAIGFQFEPVGFGKGLLDQLLEILGADPLAIGIKPFYDNYFTHRVLLSLGAVTK
jgi:hypothetical protein